MKHYNHKELEKKWQKEWGKTGLHKTPTASAPASASQRKKCYVLDMFPYPSGEGLHVGHPKGYIATDVYSRFKKMNGFNVLHPMGWDAFGLPAEQYAIKNKIHPRVAVDKNVARFKEQLSVIGFNYDWERELSTTDPKFYKWTQWIFLKLFEKGLAYESWEPINWCPSCQTGLANEDLEGVSCERCGTVVEKKPMRQWVLRITDYAERLLADLDALEWPESIKESQKNWIGKSEGAVIRFQIVKESAPETEWLGVGVLIKTKNGKYLLQERDANAPREPEMIAAFGGGRENGESPLSCGLREIKEEISIELNPAKISFVTNVESIVTPCQFLKIFYTEDVDVNKISVNEGKGAVELTYEEALAHPKVTEFTKDALRKWETMEKHAVDVFTTRPDTLFGVTFLAISAELAQKWLDVGWVPLEEIKKYIADTITENATRTYEEKEKTGIFAGVIAINPANGEEIPVWVVNYVLGDVGTGAIMAVPAHDERDFEFGKKYGLPILRVIEPEKIELRDPNYGGHGYALSAQESVQIKSNCWSGSGMLMNSGEFSGMDSEEAKKAITEFVGGKMKTTYKLRDWVFSRQRYWGEPIPIIHCDACKNKKQKVLLVHGFEGSPKGNWMPWMKAELEARGFEVFAPELPDAGHPDMDAWLGTVLPILENFTEEDIIIGHSLGSKAALHAIEKSGKKLKHAYLIASAIGEIGERDWDKRKANSTSDMDSLQKFWQAKTDYDAVSRLTSVTTIISDDDPYVPLKTHDDIPREWEFKIWRGFKHFQGKQIPELLEEFLRSKNTGAIPVPEKDLPVKLPEVEFYEPTGTGESPLANITDWVSVKCPKCGGNAKRETNTMPQWAGSSWYYLRFIDPKNSEALVDTEKEKYWSPVDMYVGGAEHATRHLIYARFWHKFLYDIGAVNYAEPFLKLHNVGLILAEDGRKMSKRWGNVVNPDDIVEEYGADTLRVYEMFMGPFEQSTAWSTEGIVGPRRFLEKVWKMKSKVESKKLKIADEKLEILLHQTIKKVTEDIEAFKFNTAISALMIFANALDKEDEVPLTLYSYVLILLSPFAPHITEELWHEIGNESSIYLAEWPKYDEAKTVSDSVTIAVQVNGKVRGMFEAPAGISEDEAVSQALALPEVRKWTGKSTLKKTVFVKGKLVSIVV